MFYAKYDSHTLKFVLYLVDSVDGYTPKTGIGAFALYLSNNNEIFRDCSLIDVSFDVTELGYGYYYFELYPNHAIDIVTNVLGPVLIHCEAALCRDSKAEGFVIPANIYDAWFSTSNQEVDISTAGLTDIAEAILKIDFSTISGEAARSLLNAARKLLNKVAISGNTLSIYKEDGVTPAFTQTVGTNSNQQPIVSLTTV